MTRLYFRLKQDAQRHICKHVSSLGDANSKHEKNLLFTRRKRTNGSKKRGGKSLPLSLKTLFSPQTAQSTECNPQRRISPSAFEPRVKREYEGSASSPIPSTKRNSYVRSRTHIWRPLSEARAWKGYTGRQRKGRERCVLLRDRLGDEREDLLLRLTQSSTNGVTLRVRRGATWKIFFTEWLRNRIDLLLRISWASRALQDGAKQ